MKTTSILRGITAAAVAATALTAIVSSASAGGFAVREQSALHQGASFAGAASGKDLSTMYWNPAGVVLDGTNTASHNSLILGQTDITGDPVNTTLTQTAGVTTNESGNIASPALVGSSYANTQLGGATNVHVGISINAPFGLTSQPDNRDYLGSLVGRTAKIFNLVGTPTVGVKLMPGVAVAAGVQIGYMNAKLKFGPGSTGNVFFQGDDYAVGWTAGVMLDPMPGTTIGLGYRSSMEYELEGKFGDNIGNNRLSADTVIETPDIITASITQSVSENVRVLATFEWTRWSTFDALPITATQAGINAVSGATAAGETFVTLTTDWDDAWYAALGLEMDIGGGMTLRTGAAYEESPIQKATQRLTASPDNNRIWLSGGLSWALSPAMSVDASYTHIFVEDGKIERERPGRPAEVFFGEAETSVDIISFGLNMKLGHDEEPFK